MGISMHWDQRDMKLKMIFINNQPQMPVINIGPNMCKPFTVHLWLQELL